MLNMKHASMKLCCSGGSLYHSPVSHQTIDDDISSVAFRSVTFTAKSMDLHFQSEGGYQATISIQKHG